MMARCFLFSDFTVFLSTCVLLCFYRHVAEEDKEECFNYRLGFCFEGKLCRQRHVPKTDLQDISELWLPGSSRLRETAAARWAARRHTLTHGSGGNFWGGTLPDYDRIRQSRLAENS
jgi:hypothetical protein